MKMANARQLIQRLFVAMAVAAVFLPAQALADAKPYFKVHSGDVFTGGWFNSQAADCSTSDANYQAPTFNPTKNQYFGGILTYATAGRKGSSVDFGALAMGLIEGDAANQYGFYSGLTTKGTGISSLNFAGVNNGYGGSYWGGYLAGSTPQVHCIPDYFDTKQNTSPAPTRITGPFDVGTFASGQYLVPTKAASSTYIAACGGSCAQTTIAAGKSVTLFVNGNVYIDHNIVYPADNTYNSDQVPKFALVVRGGNIYIDQNVTRLDGLYIAQPDSNTATTGDIWTCHGDGSSGDPDGNSLRSCNQQLTINGALIAKQVHFLRTGGDMNAGNGNSNPAEIINYTPEMVMGGPFFGQTSGSGFTVDSLVNLPPVF